MYYKLGIEDNLNLRRFKFRLQSVLNLREKNLEDERLKMAGILSLLDEQNSVLEEMKYRQKELLEDLNSQLDNSVLDIQNVCNYNSFINRISQDIKMQLDIINKTKQELEIQKLRVNEAYKEVKVLEKLKEKQQKEYTLEFEHSQTKELDDITISRYARI